MNQINLMPASKEDAPFMQDVLAMAADWRTPDDVRSGKAIVADPNVAKYVENWPTETDFGVIAKAGQVHVGAAWCRFFDSSNHGYGYVSQNVPELTVAVGRQYRGQGIGREILKALIAEAKLRDVKAISLSVESDNPALGLYQSLGFTTHESTTDHRTPTMVLTI